MKEKPEDVNMYPVGVANTWISTSFAQKSPQSMASTVQAKNVSRNNNNRFCFVLFYIYYIKII